MGVEVPRPFSQVTAALPISGERQQVAEVLDRRSVSGAKGDGSLCCVLEGLELLTEVVSLGQREMREVAGGRGLGRTLRGPERAIQRIGFGVEPEPVRPAARRPLPG